MCDTQINDSITKLLDIIVRDFYLINKYVSTSRRVYIMIRLQVLSRLNRRHMCKDLGASGGSRDSLVECKDENQRRL